MQAQRKSIKLLLVRHGETEDNKSKIIAGHRPGKLTALGKVQAEKIGQYLKKEKRLFDYIFVSDLGRTKETFQNASNKYPYLKQSSVTFTPLARQRSGGVLEGKSLTSWPQNAKKEGKDIRQYKCEGSESWLDVNKRASKILEQVVTDYLIKDKEHRQIKILIVTHGGFIMQFNNVVARIHKKPQKFDNTAKNCSMFEFLITYPQQQVLKNQYQEAYVQIQPILSNFVGHL